MEYNAAILHGGDLITCRERYGDMEFLDFSASINPLGQPGPVRAALESCANACKAYPDPFCRELVAAISRREGVPEEWIVCGNGAADIIYRAALVLGARPALLPAPTFGEYERALRLFGFEIRFHVLCEAKGFALDISILDEIPKSGIVFICNPNNPTGAVTQKALITRIADACGARGSALVLDECFLEFVKEGEMYSLMPELRHYPHVILLRSFTKMYALPGVRLGYALTSDKSMSTLLTGAAAPWSVSVPAQLCGIAAANERDFARKTRRIVAEWREDLSAGLRRLGLGVYPSSANYVMFHSKRADLAQRLCERAIAIRDCANFNGLGSGFYRVAVRTRKENDRLLTALGEIMREPVNEF